MAELISFPFRLNKSGVVATVEEGTDEAAAEELAMLCMTQPGERELVPEYGLPDLVFRGVIQEELTSKIALFGPPVSITAINSTFPRDGEQLIDIEFEPLTETYQSED
jgi:hypothetical protein